MPTFFFFALCSSRESCVEWMGICVIKTSFATLPLRSNGVRDACEVLCALFCVLYELSRLGDGLCCFKSTF